MIIRTAELQSNFPPVFKFAPGNHLKTGNTYEATVGRKF
jgi:hypothetical protein